MIPAAAARARSGLLLALTAAAVALAGCGPGSAASFDPQGPCTEDAQQPGAYPDLEARLPVSFDGAPPASVDSGRNCSSTNLGSLRAHGIDELQFAGGLWETGRRSGVRIALFRAPGLSMERLAEFYEVGARSARKTEAVTTADFSAGAVPGRRLDTLNDESYQTIVVLEGPAPDLVRAVLVASDVREIRTRAAHDEVVDRATAAAVSD